MTDQLIFGRTFEELNAMQQKRNTGNAIETRRAGDYGADPIGDGTFRMVPSGDIVDFEERNNRLER